MKPEFLPDHLEHHHQHLIFLQQKKLFLRKNYLDLKFYPYKKREIITPKLLWVRSIHTIYNPQMAIFVLGKISFNIVLIRIL